MRMYGRFKGVALGLTVVLIAGLFAGGQVEARNIKVGVIDSYSGPPAVYANDALNGFKLALEEINKEGVLGGEIEFTTRDTKFKVDIALNMAKELVLRENVDILVGIVNSGAGMAVSESVAKKEKVPLFVWIAKSENITGSKGHRYVFMTSENSAMAGKAGGVALSKKPYLKYWVAGDDYEYGHAIAGAAWRNLQALKPETEKIGESWWKPGEADLIPYLTSIEAAKPDAIIFATGGASMTNLLKALHATGLSNRIPIWVHSGTDHTVLKPLGEDFPKDVMGTMDYHFYYPDTPENTAFVEAYENAYGAPPGFPAFHGYVTANLIAKAYRKAGKIDTEKFIDAIEGLKVQSPGGEIEMRACDHQAVLPMYLGVTQKSEEYGFGIASDIVTLTSDEVLQSREQ